MKSRISKLSLGLVAALGLAACGGGTSTPAPTATGAESSPAESSAEPTTAGELGAPGSGEGLTIAFIPGIASDPFFLAMEIAAKEEAANLGVNLLWQGSSTEYSPQSQIPFVDGVLAQDIDVLILVPTDEAALQPSVQRAEEQGIPVITVDTTVEDGSYLTSYITGDNYQGGELSGEEMARVLGDEGGKVLLIAASPTITTDTLRRQGFEDKVTAEHPAIEIVGVEYHYSQPATATSIVNTYLLRHEDLAGVFAMDGTSCTGAVAALQNSDKVGAVNLICYDAYANQVDDLEAGIVTALIAQDPAQEARLGLHYAVAIATGQGVDQIQEQVVIPNVVMNADNLDETRQYTYAE